MREKIFVSDLDTKESITNVHIKIAEALVKYGDKFERTHSIHDADCFILGGPTYIGYVFNKQLAHEIVKTKKPIIIIFCSELGRHEEIGELTVDEYSEYFYSEIYDKIILAFWKDIFQDQVKKYGFTFPVFPFEFVLPLNDYYVGADSYQDFCKREYNVYMSSNCFNKSRSNLLDAFSKDNRNYMRNSCNIGSGVGDERLPFDIAMKFHDKSKISLSLEGVSYKWVRWHEASRNSVLASPNIPCFWSYPWKDGVNYIGLPYVKDIDSGWWTADVAKCKETVDKYLKDLPMLYGIYLSCIENHCNYREENYYPNYIEKTIWRLYHE
jgi:hypothetical protein